MSSDQVLGLLILSEMAIDRVAGSAFQRSPGLCRCLRLREFALVELSASAAGADLADRDQVQRAVELTVPGSGKPVATLLAAGGLDRRRAAVAGVMVAGREAADRAAVPDYLCGQHRPDAVDWGQSGARGCDRGGEVLAV